MLPVDNALQQPFTTGQTCLSGWDGDLRVDLALVFAMLGGLDARVCGPTSVEGVGHLAELDSEEA